MPHYLERVRIPRARSNMAIRYGGLTFDTPADLMGFLTETMGFTPGQARTHLQGLVAGTTPPAAVPVQIRPSGRQQRLHERQARAPRKTPEERRASVPKPEEMNKPVSYPRAVLIVRSLGGMKNAFPVLADQRVQGRDGPRSVWPNEVLGSLRITEGTAHEIIKALEAANALYSANMPREMLAGTAVRARAIFTQITGIALPLT